MKHIAAVVLALTLFSAQSVSAGALTDPILEQEIIMEDAKSASSSSGTTIVALFSLLIVGAVLSN